MQAYDCLIVNDSLASARLFEKQLIDLALFDTITVCTTLSGAFSALTHHGYDLIFLDTGPGSEHGLDLLSASTKLPPVVVMSSCDQFAVRCYDLDVADYIQPPVERNRLLRGIHRAIGLSVKANSVVTPQEIFMKVGRRLQRFVFNEIDFIEAYGIYTKIHYRRKIEVVNEPIMALEQRLPTRFFRRVHKSYIINLTRVTAYNQTNLFVDEEVIPIGVSFRPDLPNIFTATR